MALRCLLFSSNEEMIQPIWQVLADLGIEGEYCKSAVDAVERVTTQGFQIVITDWQDQPEATFLLKTARDLKAAQRPLTLAIVSDEARPQALQAGANSVLTKPIRAEQVRDTMGTACELLRSKLQPGGLRKAPETSATSATASAAAAAAPVTAAPKAAAASAPAFAPAFVTQGPEKIRAGEMLHSATPAPGAQFDTEKESHESMQAPAEEVDALTELEPMAAAVEETPEAKPEPREALSGWAALQARLTKAAPAASEAAAPKNELLSYGDQSKGDQARGDQPRGDQPRGDQARGDQVRRVPATALGAEEERNSANEAAENRASSKRAAAGSAAAQPETAPEAETEAALFAYMARESKKNPETAVAASEPKSGKGFLIGALALASVALVALPQTRRSLQSFSVGGVGAARRWLNPPPAALPPAVTQHDSFGQSGDEYKLPVVANIPDATTDPTQIRVVPVVDPTAKVAKGTDASGQSQAIAGDTTSADQTPAPAEPGPQTQAVASPVDATVAGSGNTAANPNPAPVAPAPAAVQASAPSAPPVQPPASMSQPMTQFPAPAAARNYAPQASVPAGDNAGIPSSLRSQIASSTPEASGNKPVEAAMSSIEPVNLPEPALRGLLAEQPVDPEYPAAAKASGQRGIVVLQVSVGRDGTVQDAKFLQGSFIFARAAIDAVKQWHFKPYSMNGRAVSVQSVITLNFKPPSQ